MSYYVAPSKIHGVGIMAAMPLRPGDRVGVGIAYWMSVIPYVTSVPGALINHCDRANSRLEYSSRDRVHYIVACKPIQSGREITIDYRDTPWYIKGPSKSYKNC